MRSGLVFALLLSALGLTGCQEQPQAAPEPTLDAQQQALVEQAKGALGELKAGEGKPGLDTVALCRRFFEAKQQLLAIESASLAKLWADGDKPCGLGPAQRFLFDRASRDLKALGGQLGQGSFDPQYRCVGVLQAERPLAEAEDPAARQLVAKGRKMCRLDAWLAFGAIQLDKGKVARDKDPTAKLAAECAYLQISLDNIAPEYGTDAKVQELARKRDELCSQPKKS
jgi:hypothetical protein